MAEAKVTAVIEAKDRATKVLNNFGLSLKSVGVLAAGAFAFSLGKKAVKAAADFESAMSDVSTLLDGDATEAVDKLGDSILELSKRVPKDATELGSAAYQIVSAGISDTADVMKVLEQSSKLAVAGLGETEEATDLLTSALNAFGRDASDSQDVADILFKTVKAGKTTVAELAQAFGQVAPLAATMGVSLEELQAATAALTTSGLKTSVAQTQLRAAMSSLLKPTREAKQLMDSLGAESFQQLIEQSGGLIPALGQMRNATGGNQEMFAKAMGSVEGLNAALALTGEQAETFTATMEAMTEGGQAMDEAFKKQTETFNNQVQLLKNQWNVLLVKAGTQIVPVLTTALQVLTGQFEPLVDWLANIIIKIEQFIDMLRRAKEAVLGFANRVGSSVRAGFEGAVGRVQGLLGFQSGGIVPAPVGQPRLAVVHGGERITPVTGLRGGGAGGGITVNITGNNISNEVDIRLLADEVGKEIIRVLGFAQNI